MTWFLTKMEEGLGKERKEESRAAQRIPHTSPDTVLRPYILEALNVPMPGDSLLVCNMVSRSPSSVYL